MGIVGYIFRAIYKHSKLFSRPCRPYNSGGLFFFQTIFTENRHLGFSISFFFLSFSISLDRTTINPLTSNTHKYCYFNLPAMASGGPSNSCNGSPRHGGPATKTRRRVADFMDPDSRLSNSSDLYDEEDNSNGSNAGSHLHLHHHHHHHHHHPVIRHFLFRTRALCWVPEPWLLKMEEGFLLTAMILQSLGSGRNFGRKIFGILMFMAVLTVFFKFSFLNSHVEINGKMIDKGQLIIQTFKEDWAMAQRAVAEDEAVVPKRRLEKISVSNFIFSFFFNFIFLFHPCFALENIPSPNRIKWYLILVKREDGVMCGPCRGIEF